MTAKGFITGAGLAAAAMLPSGCRLGAETREATAPVSSGSVWHVNSVLYEPAAGDLLRTDTVRAWANGPVQQINAAWYLGQTPAGIVFAAIRRDDRIGGVRRETRKEMQHLDETGELPRDRLPVQPDDAFARRWQLIAVLRDSAGRMTDVAKRVYGQDAVPALLISMRDDAAILRVPAQGNERVNWQIAVPAGAARDLLQEMQTTPQPDVVHPFRQAAP